METPASDPKQTVKYDNIAVTPRGIAETHGRKIVIFVPAAEIERITLKFGRSDHRPVLSMTIGIILGMVGVAGLVLLFLPAKANRYYLGLVAFGIIGGSMIFDTLKERYFLEVDKNKDMCRLVFSKNAQKGEIDDFCKKVCAVYNYQIIDDVRRTS